MGRDMVWHELYDRMENGNCPICDLTRDRVLKIMDGFLYESVNDPSLRDKIMRSHGFCGAHSKMLLDLGNPLAHALIYGDLLEQALKEMKGGLLGALPQYSEPFACLFCDSASRAEQTYVKAFLSEYGDSEFSDRYNGRGMLCMAHIKMMADTARKERAGKMRNIIDDTGRKYAELLRDLYEIKRKHDYRYNNEPWSDSEKTAWKRVVAVINNRAALK